MTRKETNMIARTIAAEACYGVKEHPVRLMTLHDLASSLADSFRGLNSNFDRAAFLAVCDLPAVPAADRSAF